MKKIHLCILVANLFCSTQLMADSGKTVRLDTIDEYSNPSYMVARQYHSHYKQEIEKNWKPPRNSTGAYVRVKFTINNDGTVKNPRIETLNDELRYSMQSAITMSQPYQLPLTKNAKRLTQRVETTFFVR